MKSIIKTLLVKTKIKYFFLLGVFITTHFSQSFAQEGNSFKIDDHDVPIEKLNSQITELMQQVGVPALSLAIIDNGEIVFYEAYGVKKMGEEGKVDKRTIFNGASLSKSLLAFVAYQLVDEGLLDLDKPVYQYLENKSLMNDGRYKLITSRMILSHSSGLENWAYQNHPDSVEILHQPGTKFVYSGEGYHYLADVIESILDQSYEEYVNERVIDKLSLENTFLKFTEDSPTNYVFGHRFGGRQQALRNKYTQPAYANHFTAEDYAKLVLAVSEEKYLSKKHREDLLEPNVQIGNSEVYYGPGFEVFINESDTIIGHGGDNQGYKNLMFYSVVDKKGMVMLTNDDLGKSMAKKLNDLTVRLDLESFFQPDYQFALSVQYPNPAIDLLSSYTNENRQEFFDLMDKLEEDKELDVDLLNSLSHFFMFYGNRWIALKLLEKSIKYFPNSAYAYSLYGYHHLGTDHYEIALKNFLKAQELDPDIEGLASKIEQCKIGQQDFERREKIYSTTLLNNAETLIEAEDYRRMSGIYSGIGADEGDQNIIKGVNDRSWVDYKIDVPDSGSYTMTLRVATYLKENKFEIISEDKTLGEGIIASTGGWDKWGSSTIEIYLPTNIKSIRIKGNTGEFNLNWIKFSPVKSAKN